MTLVYLVAGEESGDLLGARVMRALRGRDGSVRFAGVGGPLMVAEGLDPLFPMRELAVMGLLEVLPGLLRLRRRLHEAADDVRAKRPDVLLTIDSPGFTLRLLKLLKNEGLRRAHLVAPQAWAWREGRVKSWPGLWDRLLCLLPFEPAFFAKHGLATRFVGHPVLESGAGDGDGARFRAAHGIAADAPVLVMIPGSRRSEVSRHLGIFAETLSLLRARHPGLVPVVPVASAVAETVLAATSAWPERPIVVSQAGEKYDAFAAASVALTKSGTSTLELAMAGAPMVVTYRMNPITGWLARRVVKVRHVAIVNLLAGRTLVPELLLEECRADVLAPAVARLLEDGAAREAQQAGYRAVLAGLVPEGGGTPSGAVAEAVMELLAEAR